jgi:hypothetical protein
MKKIIMIIAMVMMISSQAIADVSSSNQAMIKAKINSAGMNALWSGDYSLWIQGNGYPKYALENMGHTICSGTRGLGFYVITFWHQFGHGKITKVTCSS